MTTVKITELTNIGANLATSTVVPVVNMAGTPTTQKTTVGNIANLILEGAGTDYPEASVALLAQTVSNAAQPNITSTGTLTGLTVSGNTNLGAVANVRITGGTAGQILSTDGAGNLSWASDSGGSYGNSNVAAYLPTYTGNVGANWVIASYFMGNAHNLTYLPGANVNGAVPYATTANSVAAANVSGLGNLALLNKDGNASNVLHGDGSWSADTTTYSNSNVASFLAAYGSNTITTTGNVSFGNVTATNLGNISAIDLDGNSSNILYGNGVFDSIPNPFNQDLNTTDNVTFANITSTDAIRFSNSGNIVGAMGYAPNYVSIEGYGSNTVNITANDIYTWTFDGNGNLTIPNGGNINFVNTGGITQAVNEDLRFTVSDDEQDGWAIESIVNDGAGNNLTRMQVRYDGVQINTDLPTNNYNWTFRDSGEFDVPKSIRGPVGGNLVISIGDQFGSNTFIDLQTRSYVGDALISNIRIADPNVTISTSNAAHTWAFGGDGLLTLPDGAIIDTTGNNFEVRAVENVNLEANSVVNIYTDGSGNAYQWQFGDDGNLTLPGNTFAVNYANGTPVSIGGGGNTGNVTFDNVTVQGVNGLNLSAGSDFTANLAYLQVRAGDVASHIHLDTGNNSAYDLIVGDDQNYVQVSSTGNILLSSYDSNTAQYTWTLDYNGNLILAGGNSVIQSIANSSLDPLNPNVSTMVLTPDANYNSQVLVLDPTAPGHIHLRAYAFSNIDEPAANIFLGGEDTAFEITSGANNQAVIHSNGKAWTFGNDGNISSDTLTFTTTFANVKTVEYQTAGVWDLYVEDSVTGSNTAISRLNVSFKDNLIDKPQVYIENTKESDGIALRWTFDENGNLNFPRDVAGNSDPYLSIFGGSTPTIQSTDVSLAGPANLAISADYLNLSGFSGDKIVFYADTGEMATDANMTLTTNLANTGNTSSWVFGTDGVLTVPGEGIIQSINDTIILQSVDANSNVYSARLGTDGGLYFETTQYPQGWLDITNNSGNANITAASGTAGGAGKHIYINAGAADQTDFYTTAGGNINITGGLGASNDGGGGGPGGSINITAGNSADPSGFSGSINITTGSNVWTFNNAGQITLPGNQGYIGPTVAGNPDLRIYNDQSSGLVRLGWQPGAVLTPGANVASNVTLDSSGFTVTTTSDSFTTTKDWVFGTGGNLAVPGSINFSNSTLAYMTTGANNYINLNNDGGMDLSCNTEVKITTNYGDAPNRAYSYFYANGNFATGSIVSSGNISGGNISTTGNISGNTNGYTIGYLNIPQVAASNTTLALGDAGKHYYSTTAGNFTLTVPNNSSAAFATGTAISIVVQAAGNILVNAASGVTLYMAGNSTAANRVVGGYGMATLMKVATDTWFINGTGVS